MQRTTSKRTAAAAAGACAVARPRHAGVRVRHAPLWTVVSRTRLTADPRALPVSGGPARSRDHLLGMARRACRSKGTVLATAPPHPRWVRCARGHDSRWFALRMARSSRRHKRFRVHPAPAGLCGLHEPPRSRSTDGRLGAAAGAHKGGLTLHCPVVELLPMYGPADREMATWAAVNAWSGVPERRSTGCLRDRRRRRRAAPRDCGVSE